jgi:hypothetical protein
MTLATAVDRLLDHPHVVLTEGTSQRALIDATSGKGVRPLD